MNIFKRSFVHIKTNLGKSALIFLIMLVTMGAISATYMSKRIYDKTLKATFKDDVVPVYAQAGYPDTFMESFSYDWQQDNEFTVKDYHDIATVDEVASSKIEYSSDYSSDVLKYPAEFKSNYGHISAKFVDSIENSEAVSYEKDGYSFDYDQDAFNNDPNALVLNDKVMEASDLNVGDTVTLDLNSDQGSRERLEELKEQEFNIVGTYSFTPTQEMIDRETADAAKYNYEPDLEFSYMYVDVFMTIPKAEEITSIYEAAGLSEWESGIWTSGTYYLDNISDIKPFKEDAEALIGKPIKTRFALSESDSDTASGLETIVDIREMLSYFFVIGLISVVIFLSVLITLFVRGRKKEIGILVALGETRRRVYYQLVIEQTIIIGFATLIVYPLCYIALQIMAVKFGFSSLGIAIMPFIGSVVFGAILTGLITIIPAVYTLRVSPKKILL